MIKVEITKRIEMVLYHSEQSDVTVNAIISVGYRVDSKQATQFRIWATNVLKEYMRKCFYNAGIFR